MIDEIGRLLKIQNLSFPGVVTGVVGAPNFQCLDLAGMGDDFFDGYWVYVVWDSGGAAAAPQGEMLECTGYTNAGSFTVAAFTAALAIGDKVLLLHPAIASLISGTFGLEALQTSIGRSLFTLDCWSAGLEEVQIDAAGATVALPDIVVADLPAGAIVTCAKVMFKFRMIENTAAGANKLNGATVADTSQVIQIRDDTPSAYVDAINFVDDFFAMAASTREGGDVIIGSVDVSAIVDGNDTYNLRYLLGKTDSDFINFNDVQVGIRIWYA